VKNSAFCLLFCFADVKAVGMKIGVTQGEVTEIGMTGMAVAIKTPERITNRSEPRETHIKMIVAIEIGMTMETDDAMMTEDETMTDVESEASVMNEANVEKVDGAETLKGATTNMSISPEETQIEMKAVMAAAAGEKAVEMRKEKYKLIKKKKKNKLNLENS
jgi:hypothetical protein